MIYEDYIFREGIEDSCSGTVSDGDDKCMENLSCESHINPI
jgi:hypothetical protein